MAKTRTPRSDILAQIPAARTRELRARRTGQRAVSAQYDAASGRVMLLMTSGILFGFPARLIAALAGASDAELASVTLSPGGGAHEDHRLALTSALKKNSARPKFYGFGWMGAVEQGVPGGVGKTGIDAAIQSTVNQKKFSTDTIVNQDKDALARVVKTFNDYGSHYFDEAALKNLKKQIDVAYNTDIYKGRVAERDAELKEILGHLSDITYSDED